MAREKELETEIFASDISPVSLNVATKNLTSAGFKHQISPREVAFQKTSPPRENGHMLINPPYDQRLLQKDIKGFYKEIGDMLKQQYKGRTAWIISSNMEAMKHIGLKPSKRFQLFNGPLQCKFQGYEMY